MADFNFKPIGTEVRPVQGASLGDMINVARGAQAYQQAQQINPLELRQQTAALLVFKHSEKHERSADSQQSRVFGSAHTPEEKSKITSANFFMWHPQIQSYQAESPPRMHRNLEPSFRARSNHAG